MLCRGKNMYAMNWTRSSACTAEGPRDALRELKSCQLLHNCPWVVLQFSLSEKTVEIIDFVHLPIRYSALFVESRKFFPSCVYVAPSLEMTSLEFHQDRWRQTTRIPRLSCDVVCVMICSVVLINFDLWHTHTHTDIGHSAGITSRGNKTNTACRWNGGILNTGDILVQVSRP